MLDFNLLPFKISSKIRLGTEDQTSLEFIRAPFVWHVFNRKHQVAHRESLFTQYTYITNCAYSLNLYLKTYTLYPSLPFLY